MAIDMESLMRANLLDVFGERDGSKRRSVIDRIYSEHVEFSDSDEVTRGRDALDAKAQRILDEAPGFVFRAAGPTYVANDMGYLAWEFGPEGADPVVRGFDVALIEGEVIAKVYTVLLA
jgi:hypothetical protein